ncbi:MAG: cell division protein FtsL [Eggerthellaceae bacterium]|nr:cell division protein FtsL [Eggerthellaceae bacterium]
MAGAAPAYDYSYVRGTAVRAPRNERRVRVVHARRPVETVSPQVVTLARVAIVVIALFAVIACARIAIHTATVNVMMRNDEIAAQIEEVRSTSASLEVQESTMGNPANVKRSAKKMGMYIPYTTETLMIGEDIVAYDEAGNLSLSKSLAVATAG